MKAWIQKWLIKPIIDFLKTGLSPSKLAASITIGFLFGIIPSIGFSTLLVGMIAVRWKLNMAAIQFVNYAAYPVQLLLLIPFLRAGALIAGESAENLTIPYLFEYFERDFAGAFMELIWISLVAVALWAVLSLIFGYPVFLLLKSIIEKLWAKENESKDLAS